MVLTLMSICAHSQSFKFGIGPAVSAPLGNFKEINNIGLGLEATGILTFSENFQGFAQVGYHNFTPKTIDILGVTIKGESTSHVPFLFGARYVSNGFMIGTGLGYGTYGKNLSGFTFSPQVGYALEKFDIVGAYTSSSLGGENLSYLGLKVFYKF